MLAFFFLLDGKRFENVAFHKRWRHNNQIISLTAFSANKIQNLTVTLLNSSGVVDGRHLRRFQSKTSRIKIGRSLVTSTSKTGFELRRHHKNSMDATYHLRASCEFSCLR